MAAFTAATAATGAGLAGRAGASVRGGDAGATPAAPAIPTPLATSVQTSDGTWATIPMGRLDEPLNTFWQLFFRPHGAASWANEVEATATATNGGLVLAPEGPSLLVGVRPSVNLTFTPLISTSDGGRSWSDGLITEELEARPGALAQAGAKALALVDGARGTRVLASSGGISKWQTLVTQAALANSGAGKACGLGALSTVGHLGPQPLIGGSCANSGVVGIFAERGGAWRLAGPALPRPLDHGRAEVLGFEPSGRGALALLAVVAGGRVDLLAAASGPAPASGAGPRWSISSALPLAAGDQVASIGPSGEDGLFALLQGPSGADRLVVADRGKADWQQLPPPPEGTGTVAFDAGGPAQALVASGSRFSVWSLSPASKAWHEGEVTHVPVQYGSSS